MKRLICVLFTLLLLLTGCGNEKPADSQSSTPSKTESDSSHSEFYVRNTSVDKILYYFNDVAFGEEYNDGKQFITKWADPIMFMLHGNYTMDDYAKINEFVDFLNSIEGFPGIMEIHDKSTANLNFHFLNRTDMTNKTSTMANGELADGFASFQYYNDSGIIYIGNVYICTELDQEKRDSVILEEFYQICGIVRDTTFRRDSIIYQRGDAPKLSDEDISIFKLLYNEDIKPNMTMSEVDEVIRKIYY